MPKMPLFIASKMPLRKGRETPESVRMVDNLSAEWSVRSALAAAEVAAGVENVVRVDNQLKAASSAGSRFRREG